MQQKTRGRAVFLLFLSFWPAGCSGISTPGPDEPEEKPLAGVTLRVCCPDELSRIVVAETSKGWKHRVGLRSLEAVEFAKGEPEERADVWVLPACALPRWAAADRLMPLPAELVARGERFNWPGLLPVYRELLLRWESDSFAVPLLGDAPLCFYRKDLFADAGHQDAFARRTGRQLAPPATWDHFADIAEYFRDARAPGKDTPSLPPLPKRDEDLDRLFYTIAASTARKMLEIDEDSRDATEDDLFAFHFDLETGKARISAPGFVFALKLLQRFQACSPSNPEAAPRESFRKGGDSGPVLCLGDARLLGAYQAADSPVRDRVGVCRVPGSHVFFSGRTGQKQTMSEGRVNRVPYLGSGAYVLAVPRSARQPTAAFELLAEIGGREMGQQIVLDSRWGGGPTRLEHLDERFDSWRLPREEAERTRTILRETIQPNLRNPLLCLRLPREHIFRAALVARLRPALAVGKASADEVLQEVAREWDALIAPHRADHIRDYRLSLGLTR